MTLTAYYDGRAIHDYAVINYINKPLQAPVNNTFHSTTVADGAKYLHGKHNQSVITMEITIKHNVLSNLDQLNKILYSRDHKPLVLGDQPERYLLCKLDGEVMPSSRRRMSKMTLRFISPDAFWRPTYGPKSFLFDAQGRVEVENLGTAPTPPKITVDFSSDCGYLALIGPNGYISLGSDEEVDKITLPSSEMALNESLTNLSSFTYLNSLASFDYVMDSFITTSRASTSNRGMSINPAGRSDVSRWQGFAYTKDFASSDFESEAQNFKLDVNVDLYNNDGTTRGMFFYLLAVLDEDNEPIMLVQMFDNTRNKNEITVQYSSGKGRHSGGYPLNYQGSLDALRGGISLEKNGSRLTYEVNHRGTSGTSPAPIRVGDTVYIKDNAQYYYHDNGTRYPVQSFTKGRPNTATAQRTHNGVRQFRVAYTGIAIAWVNETDLRTDRVVNSGTRSKTLRHVKHDGGLAHKVAKKILILSGGWGTEPIYSVNETRDLKVQRNYSISTRNVRNTFSPGDKLIIDNDKGEILLNGSVFTGYEDVANRFFQIDGGFSNLKTNISSWAYMPQIQIEMEDRWL